ncbi:hypothetical protein GCM10011352_38210 [Marinobacterium zhoushanense]|uniref:Uncharacterized protein n=1 Tax=Marinobacterium zhoushanense TaxID=1679163 RepID=A0ABQ1KRU4_9GAMM|nr:hypothetical protein [Marinobacterium zhoushanense]GGC08217.1 hypothetical protein GCM10011352_38210 [Marinobacterium zhoushanense]
MHLTVPGGVIRHVGLGVEGDREPSSARMGESLAVVIREFSWPINESVDVFESDRLFIVL